MVEDGGKCNPEQTRTVNTVLYLLDRMSAGAAFGVYICVCMRRCLEIGLGAALVAGYLTLT